MRSVGRLPPEKGTAGDRKKRAGGVSAAFTPLRLDVGDVRAPVQVNALGHCGCHGFDF
jgi:hypothetical protein